jgi:hypothetical protein
MEGPAMMVFDDFDQVGQLAGNLQNGLQQVQQQIQGGMGDLGGAIPGGLGGLLSYLPWIALAWFAYFVMRRSAGPTVALNEIEINHTARVKNGDVIRFDGRRRGFVAQLLSVLNLDPGVTWVATKEAVRSEVGGLFGRSTTIVPIRHINVIRTEFAMPRMMFFLGVLLAIVGLFNVRTLFGFVQVLVGVGLAIYAFFNKRYVVSVESTSSGPVGIAVRPSMLSGPAFDLNKLDEVGKLLQKLVRSSERDEHERFEREPAIPLAPVRPLETPIAPPPRLVEPPVPRMSEPSPPVVPIPVIPPVAGSVFQPERPPRPKPLRSRPKKLKRSLSQPAKTTPATDEEKLASEAFDAARRVFESKRPGEAEAAWWALIRRWPNTDAAKRARRILDNRRKRERERNERRGQAH